MVPSLMGYSAVTGAGAPPPTNHKMDFYILDIQNSEIGAYLARMVGLDHWEMYLQVPGDKTWTFFDEYCTSDVMNLMREEVAPAA